MQAQHLTEFKKVATIGYIVSGLGLGLWSDAPLPRLNLMGVGAVASSVALSPVRKRQIQKEIEEAKKQLEFDHADRRQQLKDWESDLSAKSTDLESRQRDLEQEWSKWEQQRVLAENQADRERTDRRRELETEWQQRFDLRAKEIEDEYRSLDAERKTLEIEQARFESERERFERHQEQERETLDKQLQETLHSGLAQLEEDKRSLEIQARQWVADSLEPLHEEIAALQSDNEALTQQLAVATYPKIPRGIDRVCVYLQEVIPALYKLGYKLDYDHHDTNPNRDRVWFRPQNTFDLKDLDKQSGLIQGLIGSKHPLCWRWIEKGLIELDVSTAGVETTTKTNKRKVSDRIVEGEQWLIDLVEKCFHFRITGENGSGKSEFFNNLYCIAKYAVFEGSLDLTLIDPKFPMSEWVIEGEYFVPQYRSWENAVNGIQAMADLVEGRLEKARENFDPNNWKDSVSVGLTPSMWALDETDTTMSQYKKEIKDNLRVGLKVGRALKVMVAYMCQSPLPDDIGLRRPDLQASANIMLSSTAEIGLENLVITPQRKLELREEIAYLNEQGCKYFALVNYPGVDPFIAKLPKPKAYAHLKNLVNLPPSSMGDVESLRHPSASFSSHPAKPIQGKESDGLGDSTIVSQRAVLGVSEGCQVTGVEVTLKPNQEASQKDIERVKGLINDGVKSNQSIVKNVWGLSKNYREGSSYLRKVKVVKELKSKLH